MGEFRVFFEKHLELSTALIRKLHKTPNFKTLLNSVMWKMVFCTFVRDPLAYNV